MFIFVADQSIHRDYNPVWGRYMSSDPLGLAAGINTYGYVGGNSLGNSDKKGLDVWIEGSSGDEPGAHLSLGIGSPTGNYKTYSFALNPKSFGCVYEDTTKGGQIIKYLKTTPEENLLIEQELLTMVVQDNKKYYGYDQICIGYTNDKYEYFKNKYQLTETNFTQRKKIDRSFKGYIGLTTSSSTIEYQRLQK